MNTIEQFFKKCEEQGLYRGWITLKHKTYWYENSKISTKKEKGDRPVLLWLFIVLLIAGAGGVIGYKMLTKKKPVTQPPAAVHVGLLDQIKKLRGKECQPDEIEVIKTMANHPQCPLQVNAKGYLLGQFVNGAQLVYIPAGEFIRGNSTAENDDEMPEKSVMLDGYWIQVYETTIGQYQAYCAQKKLAMPKLEVHETANHPITNIAREEAEKYCAWLHEQTGLDFQLPSEAQWEKAACGKDKLTYPWGNSLSATIQVNYKSKQSAAVGSFKDDVSPYGIFDLAGNVTEFTADFYQRDFYNKPSTPNPLCLDEKSTEIVIRGANFDNEENTKFLRSSNRIHFPYKAFPKYPTLGFRPIFTTLKNWHEQSAGGVQ